MKPNNIFLNLPKNFWASVRLISQEVGYTQRTTGQIKIPTNTEINAKLEKLDINFYHLQEQDTNSGNFGNLLQDYFSYRANILNTYVEPRLMDVTKARKVFNKLFKE
ncbi:hypothetical protein JZU68_09215, partial [bacterium]|nr:hypothetical protein [bacterium]